MSSLPASQPTSISAYYASHRLDSNERDPFEAAFCEMIQMAGVAKMPAAVSISDLQVYEFSREALLLIAYPSLHAALQMSSAGVVQAERTAKAWAEMAQELLQLFRKNRRCMALVDAAGLLVSPADFCETVSERLGILLQRWEAADFPPLPENHLASLYLFHVRLKNPELKSLERELEASSLPISEDGRPEGPADLSAALTYLEESGVVQAGAPFAVAADNIINILQEHLSIAHDKLEEAELDAIVMKDRINKLERELALTSSQTAQAEYELKAVRASSSWRITAPIRAVFTFIKGGGKKLLDKSHSN